MAKLLHLKDFRKIDVKKFKVYYDYVDYEDPADLLFDFVNKSGLLLCRENNLSYESGECDVFFVDIERKESVYVGFKYEGTSFEITEEHPRGGEISDLFVGHLGEKKVPWDLYEKGFLLYSEISL